MKWSEFKSFLIGIDIKSPLGRIVAIRSEDDADTLKHFTKDQHRIRNEWRNRKAKEMTEEDVSLFLEQMKQAFLAMAGSNND